MDVRPPSTWGQAAPVWRTLWQRLRGAAETPDAAALLSAARADFLTALGSLQSPSAVDLALRANHARSLRELWHLRADLYNLIACSHSQGEAERRLVDVNRHFQAQAVGARQSDAAASSPASRSNPQTKPPRQRRSR